MNLNEIKIVDLKKSDVNWDLSDPSKGKYVFHKKVYYGRTGEPGDKYFPKWVTDDKMGNIQNWTYSFDASEVKWEDKEYWPEPLRPNATHGYDFIDAVLMKINIEMWVDKVERERKMANEQVSNNKKAFNAKMESEGAELNVDMETERAFEAGKIRLV